MTEKVEISETLQKEGAIQRPWPRMMNSVHDPLPNDAPIYVRHLLRIPAPDPQIAKTPPKPDRRVQGSPITLLGRVRGAQPTCFHCQRRVSVRWLVYVLERNAVQKCPWADLAWLSAQLVPVDGAYLIENTSLQARVVSTRCATRYRSRVFRTSNLGRFPACAKCLND